MLQERVNRRAFGKRIAAQFVMAESKAIRSRFHQFEQMTDGRYYPDLGGYLSRREVAKESALVIPDRDVAILARDTHLDNDAIASMDFAIDEQGATSLHVAGKNVKVPGMDVCSVVVQKIDGTDNGIVNGPTKFVPLISSTIPSEREIQLGDLMRGRYRATLWKTESWDNPESSVNAGEVMTFFATQNQNSLGTLGYNKDAYSPWILPTDYTSMSMEFARSIFPVSNTGIMPTSPYEVIAVPAHEGILYIGVIPTEAMWNDAGDLLWRIGSKVVPMIDKIGERVGFNLDAKLDGNSWLRSTVPQDIDPASSIRLSRNGKPVLFYQYQNFGDKMEAFSATRWDAHPLLQCMWPHNTMSPISDTSILADHAVFALRPTRIVALEDVDENIKSLMSPTDNFISLRLHGIPMSDPRIQKVMREGNFGSFDNRQRNLRPLL